MGSRQGDRGTPLSRALGRRERRLAALQRASRCVPINFAVVGVQKAATSTLYRMVTKHPAVAGGPEKEIRLFLREGQDWTHPDYSDYARPAAHASHRLAGDATPGYFVWPRALERMRDYHAGMRLILCLRDPIERALSQWSMERARYLSFPDLPTAIDELAGEPLRADLPPRVDPERFSQRTMFARGLYGAQLQRGLELFPREQWLVLEFGDIIARREATLDRVTDFLGVERFSEHPRLLHENRTSTENTGPSPSLHQIARLVDRYRDDLCLLTRLSGLDVSHWPTSRVLSGELGLAEFARSLEVKLGLSSPEG